VSEAPPGLQSAPSSLEPALLAIAALHRAGRLDEARVACRELVARFPGESEPHFREGLLEAEIGSLPAADEAIGRAIALRDRPNYRYALGDVRERLGDRAGAIAAWRHVVEAQPTFAPAHVRLGVALQESGELSQAIAHFVFAVQARPEDARAWNNLAAALVAQGRPREAETAARRALAIDAGQASAALNLGRALVAQGREVDAVVHLEGVLARYPSNSIAWDYLGMCRAKAGSLLAAREAYARAVAVEPSLAGAWVRLGAACAVLGLTEESVDALRRAEALAPHDAPQVGSMLLFALQYSGRHGVDEVFAAHRAWASRYAPAQPPPAFRNPRDPARRLRLGYVSPRFHVSSAAFLSVPVIERHDRADFEVHCYAQQDVEDSVTARLRAAAANWTDARTLRDKELAARMREDGIDIAIDLAGHTPGHRLAMFAHGPAPVTGTWLDYFDTTGLEQMGFLVTDAVHSPPGDGQPFAERLVRLPHRRFCWEPPAYAPAVSPPPLASGSTAPVFGSFNRMAKLSPATLDAWCALLREVPASRLLLKNSALEHDEERAFFGQWFAQRGIDPSRIEWRGESGHEAMLAQYGDVDVVLDTFPYNGGLTTLEALWMGRPVVTVEGHTLISRQSKAILSAIGLGELCAPDTGGFVDIASRLVSRPAELARLSASLRPSLETSALLDHAAFTRDFEALLRGEWRRWCEGAG
jgi:predicted O-linked N-acetylglucosamine transferase (SPINDLY family)